MKIFKSDSLVVLTFILFTFPVFAQDITRLGGDLSTDAVPKVALELPAPNISSDLQFEKHLEGHTLFHTDFRQLFPAERQIVGPRFNAATCGECHFGNGKGAIKFRPKGLGSPMLVKVSLKGLNPDGTTRNLPGAPEQLKDHEIGAKSPHSIKLKFIYTRGKYPDGRIFELRKPIVDFSIPGADKKIIVSSLRMSPSIIGMGLIDALPEKALIELTDPLDSNHDGIKGKVNFVTDVASNTKKIGKFGFKASHPSLIQQSAAALFNDMGVTNSLFNDTKQPAEFSDDELEKVVFFQIAGGVPVARDQDKPEIIAGKAIFQQINCSACHVMTLKTGESGHPETSNQEFHPFSDFLLHDMGPGLADQRAEFFARGTDWRTTPLWGIGLTRDIARHKPGFLHDGRARSIEEAILWHGGEAKRSMQAFMNLKHEDRLNLIKFLNSL